MEQTEATEGEGESISIVEDNVEEEALEEESVFSDVSNTQEILDQMIEPHEEHDHYELDLRKKDIFYTIRSRIKEGPKPPVMEAEEQKQGIERQLEDNTKQFNTLIEYGKLLLGNIKASREKADKFRRETLMKKRREMERRIRQETIEADAQYGMIRSKWSELDGVNDVLDFFYKSQIEKTHVDEILKKKDQLVADCQAEIDRLNQKFDEDLETQNESLNCFGQLILNQNDLFSKATQGQIDLLEGTIDDEWQYMTLINRQKYNEVISLVNYDIAQIFEILNAKDDLYEKEINKLIFEQSALTLDIYNRFEKVAGDVQFTIRQARFKALLNSEMLDYNYNVLQQRHAEDITLSNQQKRRVASIVQNITLVKQKMKNFRRESLIKLEKLQSSLEKLHASISDLQVKSDALIGRNKRQFDKLWAMEYQDIVNTMNEVFEIDRILYRTQLAKCWDPLTCELPEMEKLKELSRKSSKLISSPSSETVNLNAEKEAHDLALSLKKDKQYEIRFMRNILRKISNRSKIFFESKLYEEMEKLAEDEKYVICVDNVLRILKITNIDKLNELMKYIKIYSWCPNCQAPPTDIIIKKLYNVNIPSSENSEEEKPKCDNHELVLEPLLLLTALKEFLEDDCTKIDTLSVLSSFSSEPLDSIFSTDKIVEYFKDIYETMSKERLNTWKAMEHGLMHFDVLLEERVQLHDECLRLSRQNAELRYFIGENVEITDPEPEPTNVC